MSSAGQIATWSVSAATMGLILVRPRGIPEWCWAVAGAALLIAIGSLTPASAANAVWSGFDVYLFLAGMLALAELARVEGVFDWLAAYIVPRAGGSQARLFGWVYVVGIVVTAFLSNDATVLLLTPAVLASARLAGASLLPFAYACAFVANAASFVLPISNPANLVVFEQLPALGPWLRGFLLPSIGAICVTYIVLRILHPELEKPIATSGAPIVLSRTGTVAAIFVALSAVLIVIAAAFGWPVGVWAFLCGAGSLLTVALLDDGSPRAVLRESPWSIIPMVAGLFVIVAALDRSGVLQLSRNFFHYAGTLTPLLGKVVTESVVSIADNVLNNLPVGVLVRYSLHDANVPARIAYAALVGVDVGPHFSVTGSLATLLWLITLRREGIDIRAGQFLKVGMLVTIPSLLLTLFLLR